jgi:hypothetical protein
MLLIDDEWCYIHIPKTSGTNLRETFKGSSHYIQNYDVFGNVLQKFKPIHDRFWQGYDCSQLKRFVFLDLKRVDWMHSKHAPLWIWQEQNVITSHHKVFTIARNPYTRLVSVYQHFIRTGEALSSNYTLSKFVNDPAIQSIFEMFPYRSDTTPQIEFLKDSNGNVTIDRVYKMETDLPKLESDFHLDSINKIKYNSGDYIKNYKELYDDDLISWVQTTFKEDFEFFDYQIQPFWM